MAIRVVESSHSVDSVNRVISHWGSQSPVMCASCHSEVTVAGVGPFGVLEGFHEGSFQSSVARTRSPARLVLFKQFSRAVGSSEQGGDMGPYTPFSIRYPLFSYWSSTRGFI